MLAPTPIKPSYRPSKVDFETDVIVLRRHRIRIWWNNTK